MPQQHPPKPEPVRFTTPEDEQKELHKALLRARDKRIRAQKAAIRQYEEYKNKHNNKNNPKKKNKSLFGSGGKGAGGGGGRHPDLLATGGTNVSYAMTILAENPTAYWTFNEWDQGAGKTYYDEVLAADNGTGTAQGPVRKGNLYGGLTYTQDNLNAAYFNSTGYMDSMGTQPSFTTKASFSMWVMMQDVTTGAMPVKTTEHVLYSHEEAAASQGFRLALIKSGSTLQFRLRIWTSRGLDIYTSTDGITDYKAHHLGYTLEQGQNPRVYLDGVEVTLTTLPGTIDQSLNAATCTWATIGRQQTALSTYGNGMLGFLDEFACWNDKVLVAADYKRHYDAGMTKPTPVTETVYDFSADTVGTQDYPSYGLTELNDTNDSDWQGVIDASSLSCGLSGNAMDIIDQTNGHLQQVGQPDDGSGNYNLEVQIDFGVDSSNRGWHWYVHLQVDWDVPGTADYYRYLTSIANNVVNVWDYHSGTGSNPNNWAITWANNQKTIGWYWARYTGTGDGTTQNYTGGGIFYDIDPDQYMGLHDYEGTDSEYASNRARRWTKTFVNGSKQAFYERDNGYAHYDNGNGWTLGHYHYNGGGHAKLERIRIRKYAPFTAYAG